LRRMRTLYDRRRQRMVRSLETHFGSRVEILGENSGMHLMIRLQTRWNEKEVIQRAATVDVGLVGAGMYYLRRPPGDEFVLAYAGLNERKIQEGVRRLAKILCG